MHTMALTFGTLFVLLSCLSLQTHLSLLLTCSSFFYTPPVQATSAGSKPPLDELVSQLLTDSDLLEMALSTNQHKEADSLLTYA